MTAGNFYAILTVLTQLIQFTQLRKEVVHTVTINYRDARPIYEQVCDGLRKLIMTGALPPGEKLPSVRELAQQLSINPNTIQRAYRTLEQEGYISSVAGKGSFAMEPPAADSQRKQTLLRQFDELVKELRYLGVKAESLRSRIGEEGEDK